MCLSLSSFHSQCLEQTLIHNRNLVYNYWTNEENQGGRVCLSQLKTIFLSHIDLSFSNLTQSCPVLCSNQFSSSSVMISLEKKWDFNCIFPIPYPISKTFICWGYPKCVMFLLMYSLSAEKSPVHGII